MARYTFGGGIADWSFGTVTVSGTGNLAQLAGSVTISFWSAETGGAQYTDLIDSSGSAVTTITSSDGTSGRAIGQIPPFQGPDGVRRMWAQAGTGPRALIVSVDDPVDDLGVLLPPLSVSGTVTAGVGAHRLYNDTAVRLTIAAVRASVGTAPTGSALIVDVNRNGSSIYPTQANRPTIAVGANTSGKNVLAEVTQLDPGDYLTVDVDQAGTGAQNLVVQILVTKG